MVNARHRGDTVLKWMWRKLWPAQTSAVPAQRIPTIELVDADTAVAHRVTDDEFGAGQRAGGRYQTLCGKVVLPASLTAPARGYCPACERA